MPRAPKATPHTKTRSMPYPPVVTRTTMAPVSAADSLPTPASGERHDSKPWGPEEDATLLRQRRQGMNWGPIADRFFPTKTANACRKRHERLLLKSNRAGDWDNARLETLAQLYMEFREQMWKILAEKMDEKWETVEIKCMEKGIKNLRNHGRSRKNRSGDPEDDGDDEVGKTFDDSGLGAEIDPNDEIASRDRQNQYSRGIQHDQQPPYPSGGVSAAPSIYGFSSGAQSSAPSYGTTSRASSAGHINTPQQHNQSLPETLPGIASIFNEVTRY